MINQKDPLQMVIGVMLPEMIGKSKDASDITKRAFQKRLHSRKYPHVP